MTTENINILFVIPEELNDQNDCSEEMLVAYAACENHQRGGLQARWTQANRLDLDKTPTKRDVIVISEFKGELFERLKNTTYLVVGPRCLSYCLMEGIPIPSRGHPVFTMAMRGLIVTGSGLSKNVKDTIKQRVEWMGGVYSPALTEAVTHLVTSNVLSQKYTKATERGLPVMRETWVEAVWEASLRANINGSSADFDEHKLPPFANLNITSTGLSTHEKTLLIKLINANGGQFSPHFQSKTTDVLIVTKDNIESKKCKAAREFGKVCVTPRWIKDSAAVGFALPVDRYGVFKESTSSPISERRPPDMSLNFSRITKDGRMNHYLNETKPSDGVTILSDHTAIQSQVQESRRESGNESNDIQKAFENFDLSKITKAGPIFDGFCIWVTGMDGSFREQVLACVTRAGGVRYDGPHEFVTHVVAGSKGAAASAAAALPTVPVLSPLWVLRSVEAGRVLNEIEFEMSAQPATPIKTVQTPRSAVASPMSKRNLQLLRTNSAEMPPPPPPPPPQDDHIVNHYLSQPIPEDPPSSPRPGPAKETTNANADDPSIAESEFTVMENTFKDLIFEVQGLEDEAVCDIGEKIQEAGGKVVEAGAGCTHVLVPLDYDANVVGNKDAEVVTVFWVKDCLSQQAVVPIEYYHRPVAVHNATTAPLKGVVASLSTYAGVERMFLEELARLLGATMQQRFCRRDTAVGLASTHLICPKASGPKYAGSVKWGVPAVRASWLLECAASGCRVHEAKHCVDNPADRTRGISNQNETIAEEQQSNNTNDSNTPQKANRSEANQNDRTVTSTTDEPLPPKDLESAPSVSTPGQQEPKKKLTKKYMMENMSPGTRFITMNRLGMFDPGYQASQDDPEEETVQEVQPDAALVRTPPIDEVLSTPNLRFLSPSTRRRVQALKRGEAHSSPAVTTPVNPFAKQPKPPSEEIGADLRPGTKRMSLESRKNLWGLVSDLPSKEEKKCNERKPLVDLCGEFLSRFERGPSAVKSFHHIDIEDDDDDEPPSKVAKLTENQKPTSSVNPPKPNESIESRAGPSALSAEVDVQLQRLNVVLTGRSTPRARARPSAPHASAHSDVEYESGPDSQPNTVGWDDTTPSQRELKSSSTGAEAPPPTPCKQEQLGEEKKVEKKVKRFMLSSTVDNREEIVELILRLGGEVTDLPPVGTDELPTHTHLLCAAPARSRRVLASVAAGCWLLHPSYVARSAPGALLPEEPFEWGNPAAESLPQLTGSELALAKAAYRWRSRRARGEPGPYAAITAYLHVPAAQKHMFASLILAGEGKVAQSCTDDNITVCFADPKRCPMKEQDKASLISRGIPVCPPVLLSTLLLEETRPCFHDHCLPEFKNATV